MTQHDCATTGASVQIMGRLELCEQRACPHGTCKRHLHKYRGKVNWEHGVFPRPTNKLWLNDGRG